MAKLSHHLDVEEEKGNYRNGSNQKTVLSPACEMRLNIPRDRLCSFEPRPVAKHQRRTSSFDDHVISMYAGGLRLRGIQGHLLELYGTNVWPDLISTITDQVMEEVMDEVNRLQSGSSRDRQSSLDGQM